MVSHFLGCNNLVRLMFLMFMSFLFLQATPAMAGRQINPLVEFSSREELAEMAGYGEEKLSTVLVSGTVLCEACSDENGQTNPQTMSVLWGGGEDSKSSVDTGVAGKRMKVAVGRLSDLRDKNRRKTGRSCFGTALQWSSALVAVSCHTNQKTSKSNWVESTTDEFGDFLIDLPSHLHAIPNLDKRCLVKISRLPKNSPCHPAFTGKQTGLKLSSAANGIRTYTAENLYLTRKTSPKCMFAGNGEGKSALVKAY
ncbi:pollen Ole e 1 allergen and extensin family protein [Actinidia rufa]|uniref:Pollen Ole e 1 allergen and extensin family protein n=1 Tax=Actinidia rufa TaxID=165716 RepID=A0A7J0GIJ8_9ERIC|nr:pollen Ole e 1 allergen and extensin family protein [Actinidia rufa]